MQAAAAALDSEDELRAVGGNTALALTMAAEGADALEYSQSMDLGGLGGLGIQRQSTEQLVAAAMSAASGDDDGSHQTTASSETDKMLAAAGVAKPSLKDVAVSVEQEEGPVTKQTPAALTAPKPGLTKQSTLALLNSTAKTMDVDEEGKPKASATEILQGVAQERAEAERAEAEKLRRDPSAIQKALAKSFQETQVTHDEATTQLKFAAAEEADSATMAVKMGLTQDQIEMERAGGAAHLGGLGLDYGDDGVTHAIRCTTGHERRSKKPPESISRAGFLATRSSKPGGLGSFHLSQAHVALLANTRRIERGPYLMNTNGELLTDRKGRLILRANALKLLSKSKNMNPISQRRSASSREKEKKLKRILAEVHDIRTEAEIERVVEFNNNENKVENKSTRQRINELARPEVRKDSGIDPELYLLGKDVIKRAGHFTKLDDAINCTFKPKLGKKWAEGDKDDDEEKDAEDNNFIKRQDAWFRETRAEMDMRRGKEHYEAGLNRKICPNCIQPDGKLVFQAYDEHLEKRDTCSVCSSKYVNQNSWSKVSKDFFRQQDEFEVKKESNLKSAEKKYITDVCDPRKVMNRVYLRPNVVIVRPGV